MLRLVWLLALPLAAAAQQIPVKACAVLEGNAREGDSTFRIQSALDLCSSGQAVVLRHGEFDSHSLILPRAVTLFINADAYLRGIGPWDITPGSCGATPKKKEATCKPFIFAYQAAFSGVMGNGNIQGDAPELISSYESQGFTLSGVTLRDSRGTAAAIYKTTGFRSEALTIQSQRAGMLLSNAVDARVRNSWIRAEGDSIDLQSSVLGPTTNVRLRDIHTIGGGGIVKGTGNTGDLRNIDVEGVMSEDPQKTALGNAPKISYVIDLSAIAKPGTRRSFTVSPGESIQRAVDALPVTGGEISIKPGTYREVVTIRKPNVRLHGQDSNPAKTVIVFNNGPAHGGTFASGTVYVEAPNVTIDHLTIANDLGIGKGQAVALAVTADRAIFRDLRILGAQDTLFAASRYCYGDYGPCEPARQYFVDSYIEGNTDFIFGDSLAVFERCELHGVSPGTVMYTAQSRHTAEQTESAYVFDRCRLTAAERTQGSVSLGRPWRPYATVLFLHAAVEAPVIPAGWTEWVRFGIPSLPTAFYAEFDSTGPGGNPRAREPHAHQLTAAEAAAWSAPVVLAGRDNWRPE
ncbi:MAG TPA: pectinesterase family protein [Bryobacteraceae bacterium]|nr:pectinesterase family protein [Bryobacteraceae bacterium]